MSMILIALSPIVFREKLTGIKLSGLLAVFLGMLFVNYQGIAHINITGLENIIYQLSFRFAVVCIFTLLRQGLSIHIPMQSIFPILCLGVINTGIGCYLYFSSITKLPAQSVAICGYLEPVSALVFSALFLSEQLTLIQLIGTVFILGGAAFAELFKRQRL